ncbi:hypothetical protein ABT072_43885 [Streptomyces sp. NPDC002589]|uniref:hypothetical protein n=1 Tax=Streptomyces sp. NPDC002589 TaxID=3154420 RepID=UPI00332E7EC8
MATPEEEPEIAQQQPEVAPLSRWERLAASLSGIALSGAGATAVFITSNQAGSVALLLVGVVLLVMAINGSPLTRARYQDYELFMARRRRQIVATINQDSPEEARQALQVLSAVDPGASRDPLVARVSALVLEREVFNRLMSLYPSTVVASGPESLSVDAVIPTERGAVGVEIKAGTTPLSASQLRDMALSAAHARSTAAPDGVGALLVVTNKPLPSTLPRRLRELRSILPIAVVRWVDAQDDQALQTQVQRLSDQIGSSE